MMPEEMMKMLLDSMLPLKFDTKIKITLPKQGDKEINIQGDIFLSKTQGESEPRIIIAIKTPGAEK